MSVVGYEVDATAPDFSGAVDYWCLECHRDMQTSMNIGLGELGVCTRCGATRHKIYMIEANT